MKRSRQFACALILAFTTSLIALAAELPANPKATLQLTIETPHTTAKASEGISFTINFHNNGSNDLLLNGGELLGNGSQMWTNLEAELKNEAGEQIPMTLGWGIPGVAGRVYFLGLPLRAGSTCKLPARANDYLIGSGEKLKPGKYSIRFIYRSRQSPHRDATQMPACWEGVLHSNTLEFEVLAD